MPETDSITSQIPFYSGREIPYVLTRDLSSKFQRICEINCARCGLAFRVKPSHLGRTKYCSRKCRWDSSDGPARFWKNVEKNGPLPERYPHLGPCWIWKGDINDDGYGTLQVRELSERVLAHRYAWIVGHGKIPRGKCVLHRCDIRNCVNYEAHLFVGSRGDNNRDTKNKDRFPIEQKRPNAKLTVSQAKEIAILFNKGTKVKEICQSFPVTCAVVYSIINRKSWRSATVDVPFPRRRKTGARGEDNIFAKLTPNNVRSIRSLAASGLIPRQISERLNLSVHAVRLVAAGRTWKHLL